jgi:hypothetical protein
MKKLLNMGCAGATKRRLTRFYPMARKPEQKPKGEQGLKRVAEKNRDELAASGKSRGPDTPHCGDMGLASRERQFRPGSGGR